MDIRGPNWNTMSEILLEILRSGGGVVIFGGGFAKRGVRTNPRTSPWLRACKRTGCVNIQKHNYIANYISRIY